MDEFSRNGSCSYGMSHANDIEISKKYLMSFPELRLCQTPENVTFGKILDEFPGALGLYMWVPLQWSLLTRFYHVDEIGQSTSTYLEPSGGI